MPSTASPYQYTTFDLTTGVMLDFEPLIQQLDPFDTPLTGGMGADGRSSVAMSTCYEVKVEWQDETGLVARSTIRVTTTTGDGWIVLATGDTLRFQSDDILLVGTEYMLVTGYGSTTDSLTVTRAYAGSTAVTAAATTDVVCVGQAPLEGADPMPARMRDRTGRFNYTQIFGPYAVTVSGTENAVRKYGLAGTEFDKQTAGRLRELAVVFEATVIYGTRNIDTTNKRRAMGGIDYYTTTNVDTTTTQISETAILNLAQTVFVAGGNPDRALVPPQQKRAISQFATGTIQLQETDRTRGRIIDYYDSDFGRLSIILDRWVRKQNMYLFNRDQVEICTLRPIVFQALAKTGDSEKGMIVGEKSLRFARDKHAAKFTALT